MDRKLVAWALMVKTRSKRRASAATRAPCLWLFTDSRLADPAASIRALASVRAPGLFGVVLRGTELFALASTLTPICRRAHIPILVASDVRLAYALRAGVHLPSGRRSVLRPPRGRLLSASAHDATELRRAMRSGADLVFVSPVFPTASHPGTRALGPRRAAVLARTVSAGTRLMALGGVDGASARALPGCFSGAGAISALSAPSG